ncbi:hypothetical protein, partial [Candidatus Mycoplasma haematobovis]|uniref:hypothetical protein n=1 Tax=Candidatus Mycoplasma haematobovis TaxID=432608 RepID=UPI000ABB1881
MEFKDLVKRLLNFLEQETNQFKTLTNNEEEHLAMVQYCNLLKAIEEYTLKKTEDGTYDRDSYCKIKDGLNILKKRVNEELLTKEWERYITIFFSGKEKKFRTMTTNYGKEIWKREDTDEGQIARKYWHKIQVIIGDYHKELREENKIKNSQFTDFLPISQSN